MSNNILQIDTEEALEQFLLKVDRLHDTILHEALLVHPGYVDQERQMWGDVDLPSARLIFQSQSRDCSAVQLDLQRIKIFRLDFERSLELDARFEDGDLILHPCGREFADSAEIRALYAQYRILGRDFLGKEYKLGHFGLTGGPFIQ